MSISARSLDTSDPVPIPAVALPPQDSAVPAEVYAEVARLGLGEHFPAAIALTREIFGDFTIDISIDPELYDCSYVTFNVRTGDTLDNVLPKESEWFSRVRWPSQAVGSFCLNVAFV